MTVVLTVALITAVFAVVLSIVGGVAFDALWKNLPFRRFGWPILLGAFGQVLFGFFFLTYRNAENVRGAFLISVMTSGLSTAAIVFAVLHVRAEALSVVVGRALGFTALLPFVFVTLRGVELRIDRALLRRLFAFGFPIVGYTLIAYLLFNGDRVLMQRWFGLAALGVYALAATLVSTVETLLQAAQQAAQPRFYRMLANDEAKAADQISRFYVVMVLMTLVGSVGVVLLAQPLLFLVKGKSYYGAVPFIAVLSLGQLFRVQFTGHVFPIFYAKKSGGLPVVTAAALVIGLVSALVLAKLLGPMGIAWAIVGWKFAQQWLVHRLGKRIGAVTLDLRPSYAPIAGFAAWTLGLNLTAGRGHVHDAIAWGGGALLIVLALWFGARLLRAIRAAGGFASGAPVESVGAPAEAV
jgi:O-antigen/teichoic acid export membrane protein